MVLYIPATVPHQRAVIRLKPLFAYTRTMQSTLAQSHRMTVVQPCGHINADTADALRQRLIDTVSSHDYSALMVDMSAVESLDSSGLMALVSTLRLARRLNKGFGLFGVTPSVRIIFELTQLDRVFDIVEQPEPIAA